MIYYWNYPALSDSDLLSKCKLKHSHCCTLWNTRPLNSTRSMRHIHGEQISHRATGQGHSAAPVHTRASENRAALCNGELAGPLGEHFLSGVGRGRQAGNDGGKSWHLMDRLCVFSSERPLHPTRGFPTCLQPIVLRIFADQPAAPEAFKGRKEESSRCWPTGYIYSEGVNMLLWTDPCQQQDVWQSQRHIFGTETLEHSFAFFFIFSLMWKGEPGPPRSSRWRTYLCGSR